MGDRLQRFVSDRRADDVSFGLRVRIALTCLIVIPVWWVVGAAIDMATLNADVPGIFLGAAGIALIMFSGRYLSDLWRPTHLSRKQAIAQRTRENRLEMLLRDPPNDPPPVLPRRW